MNVCIFVERLPLFFSPEFSTTNFSSYYTKSKDEGDGLDDFFITHSYYDIMILWHYDIMTQNHLIHRNMQNDDILFWKGSEYDNQVRRFLFLWSLVYVRFHSFYHSTGHIAIIPGKHRCKNKWEFEKRILFKIEDLL